MAPGAAPALGIVRHKVSSEDWIMRGILGAIALYLLVAIVLPLYALLSKGFQDKDGNFTGLDNFTEFFDQHGYRRLPGLCLRLCADPPMHGL